jgi:hypothetical protein
LSFETRQQEGVDGSAHGLLVANGRRLRPFDRLEGPELPLFLRDEELGNLCGLGSQRGRALFDPVLDLGDLFRRKFLLALGHLARRQHLQHHALAGLAWDHHVAGFAVREHEAPQPEINAALEFLALTVAIEAMRLENWTDVALEGERGRSQDGGSEAGREKDHQCHDDHASLRSSAQSLVISAAVIRWSGHA